MKRRTLFIGLVGLFLIGSFAGTISLGRAAPGRQPESPDIRDIKIMTTPPFASHRLLSLLALALLAFGAGVYGLARNRKKKDIPHSPYESALLALAALERKDLLAKGEIVQYDTELADIVRTYLETAYGLMATARTTEELLSEIREKGMLPSLPDGLLSGFLTRCDLVKFAGYQPSPEEQAALLSSAHKLIEQTKECPDEIA